MLTKRMYSYLGGLYVNLMVNKQEGATMAEYGLLVALIACACITAVTLVGTDLSAFFTAIAGQIQGVAAGL